MSVERERVSCQHYIWTEPWQAGRMEERGESQKCAEREVRNEWWMQIEHRTKKELESNKKRLMRERRME